MATFYDKLSISLGSGALLLALNSKYAFRITGYQSEGCPTLIGRLIHLLIFLVITFLTMPSDKPMKLKAKHSWYGFLIAFLVFSPQIITLVNNKLATASNGCLSTFGTILHVLIYVAILVGVMYL